MKRLGLITKNKVFAQSLSLVIKNNLDLPFEPYVLHSFKQASVDAEILGIDVAVIEMVAENPAGTPDGLLLCNEMRRTNPDCRILLLISPDHKHNRDTAIRAANIKAVDDYVFLDTSLDYLFAKLLAL